MGKTAFVHCWMFPGWALNVFMGLIKEEYQEEWDISWKIFTLISEETYLDIWDKRLEIIQSLPNWISKIFIYCRNNKIPILSWIFDYRNLIFFYPGLMKILSRKIRKFWAKKIIISSFAVAKNISVKNAYKKLYLHSPIQYVRSHYDEYSQKIKWRKWLLFRFITPILRKRDKKFIEFDECRANSKYTAELAKDIYGMNCKVKYPKIDDEFFGTSVSSSIMPYFVYVWRLVSFVKECDVIIRLFNKTWALLIMVWSWPDELYLKSIAQDNIMFLWRWPIWMIDIIKNAKWFINLTKESFWMWTAESLLLWVPVLGYKQWGSAELVDDKSGILVEDKSLSTLVEALIEFDKRKRDRKNISENIRKKLDFIK